MLCEADLAVGSVILALVAAGFALNTRWLVIESKIVVFGQDVKNVFERCPAAFWNFIVEDEIAIWRRKVHRKQIQEILRRVA